MTSSGGKTGRGVDTESVDAPRRSAVDWFSRVIALFALFLSGLSTLVAYLNFREATAPPMPGPFSISVSHHSDAETPVVAISNHGVLQHDNVKVLLWCELECTWSLTDVPVDAKAKANPAWPEELQKSSELLGYWETVLLPPNGNVDLQLGRKGVPSAWQPWIMATGISLPNGFVARQRQTYGEFPALIDAWARWYVELRDQNDDMLDVLELSIVDTELLYKHLQPGS